MLALNNEAVQRYGLAAFSEEYVQACENAVRNAIESLPIRYGELKNFSPECITRLKRKPLKTLSDIRNFINDPDFKRILQANKSYEYLNWSLKQSEYLAQKEPWVELTHLILKTKNSLEEERVFDFTARLDGLLKTVNQLESSFQAHGGLSYMPTPALIPLYEILDIKHKYLKAAKNDLLITKERSSLSRKIINVKKLPDEIYNGLMTSVNEEIAKVVQNKHYVINSALGRFKNTIYKNDVTNGDVLNTFSERIQWILAQVTEIVSSAKLLKKKEMATKLDAILELIQKIVFSFIKNFLGESRNSNETNEKGPEEKSNRYQRKDIDENVFNLMYEMVLKRGSEGQKETLKNLSWWRYGRPAISFCEEYYDEPITRKQISFVSSINCSFNDVCDKLSYGEVVRGRFWDHLVFDSFKKVIKDINAKLNELEFNKNRGFFFRLKTALGIGDRKNYLINSMQENIYKASLVLRLEVLGALNSSMQHNIERKKHMSYHEDIFKFMIESEQAFLRNKYSTESCQKERDEFIEMRNVIYENLTKNTGSILVSSRKQPSLNQRLLCNFNMFIENKNYSTDLLRGAISYYNSQENLGSNKDSVYMENFQDALKLLVIHLKVRLRDIGVGHQKIWLTLAKEVLRNSNFKVQDESVEKWVLDRVSPQIAVENAEARENKNNEGQVRKILSYFFSHKKQVEQVQDPNNNNERMVEHVYTK